MLIQQEKINYMFAVPVMFQVMTKSEEWERADFSHVHLFISGGAPIPVPVIREYQEKGVGFVQAYGMTEAGRLTALDLEDSIRKAGSVGKEVFHMKLRIVDEQNRDVPPGEAGEIIVMGRRDEEGFLYVIGRKQELIISAGENIYPAEVERALQAMPEVREAAAVAMPDETRGEVVAAFVMLHDGRQASEEQIISGLDVQIASFKIPKKVIFVQDFPRNPAGKILRRELKKPLWPEEK
jgi:fatty-acyl-CoA synthase